MPDMCKSTNRHSRGLYSHRIKWPPEIVEKFWSLGVTIVTGKGVVGNVTSGLSRSRDVAPLLNLTLLSNQSY